MVDSKNPNYHREVSESIKSVFDLTSRIDERVKYITKKQDEMSKAVENQRTKSSEVDGRMRVLESIKDEIEKNLSSLGQLVHTLELSLQQVQIRTTGQENKWKTAISFSVQIAWVILAAYLLAKLGVQAPAVP